jgi:hypothetical protein
MKKNFVINSNYLIQGNCWFDLHNDYYLADKVINEKHTILTLVWNKRREEWVNPNSAMRIYLLFDQISLLECSNDFLSKPCSPSFFIDELGYLPENEVLGEGLYGEQGYRESSHIVFGFLDNEYIRVACGSIIFSHI